MNRIAVLTASTIMFKEVLNITLDNKKEYCDRHGYELLIKRHTELGPNETIIRTEREEFILESLIDRDYVLFMGADTCFSNMNIMIEDLLDDDPDFVYGFCEKEVAGIPGINNDVLLIKNSEQAKAFLNSVIKLMNCYKFPHDQAAMGFLLSQSQLKTSGLKVKKLPQKVLNAMPQWYYNYDPKYQDKETGLFDGEWTQGDWIFHAPGLPLETRIELITKVLEKVER